MNLWSETFHAKLLGFCLLWWKFIGFTITWLLCWDLFFCPKSKCQVRITACTDITSSLSTENDQCILPPERGVRVGGPFFINVIRNNVFVFPLISYANGCGGKRCTVGRLARSQSAADTKQEGEEEETGQKDDFPPLFGVTLCLFADWMAPSNGSLWWHHDCLRKWPGRFRRAAVWHELLYRRSRPSTPGSLGVEWARINHVLERNQQTLRA